MRKNFFHVRGTTHPELRLWRHAVSPKTACKHAQTTAIEVFPGTPPRPDLG